VATSVPGHVVYLSESYPSSTTTWTVIGRVGSQNLTGGETMAVTAYAVRQLRSVAAAPELRRHSF
jgi:hypothetical protein